MRNEILAAIREVPRGHVSTYGGIARAAGYPGAARQVVAALRSAYDVPWHRIVGAGGAIKLRGDSAIEQRLRLEAEGVTFRGRRVNMRVHEHRFGRPKRAARRKPTSTGKRARGRRSAEWVGCRVTLRALLSVRRGLRPHVSWVGSGHALLRCELASRTRVCAPHGRFDRCES